MKSPRIGILAEDSTDCEALAVLVRRCAAGATIGIKAQSFGGSGRLRQKAAPTLKLMAREGCSAAVLVHDLDRDPRNGELNDEVALRRTLEAIESPIPHLVCIPVEELEAWFWSDSDVLALVGPGAKDHPSPHLVRQPKEKLIALSRGAHGKARYSTLMNKALAERLDLDRCAARCRAFDEMRSFLRELLSG